MIIRKLQISELSLLTQLHDYPDPDNMIAENTKRMASGSIDIFCAFENNLLLGELRVKYESEDIIFAQRGRRAYLYAFRVQKAYQGQGIGTQLLKEAMEILSGSGYTEFTIGVEEDNIPARHMYEKHGFSLPIARIRESYQGDAYEYDLLLKQNGFAVDAFAKYQGQQSYIMAK